MRNILALVIALLHIWAVVESTTSPSDHQVLQEVEDNDNETPVTTNELNDPHQLRFRQRRHHRHHHRRSSHSHHARFADADEGVSQVGTCWNGTTASSYRMRSTACGNTVLTQVPPGFVVTQIDVDQQVSPCSIGAQDTMWKKVRYMQYDGWVSSTVLGPAPCVVGRTGDYGGHGVDVSDLCGAWDCLAAHNYTYAIVRIYQESNHGQVDQSGGLSLQQAARAGFWTDAYMYVSGFDTTTGVHQASQVIAAIRNLPVGRVWIDVEGVGTSWNAGTTNAQRVANQQLFQDIVTTFQAANVSCGIYTQWHQYNAFFGSSYSFAFNNNLPVWWAIYASEPHGGANTADGHCKYTPTTDSVTTNWHNFGRYTSGLIKQYNGDCVLCGCGFDVNIKAVPAASSNTVAEVNVATGGNVASTVTGSVATGAVAVGGASTGGITGAIAANDADSTGGPGVRTLNDQDSGAAVATVADGDGDGTVEG